MPIALRWVAIFNKPSPIPSAVGGRAMLGVEFLWPIQIAGRPENSR